ncbi:MAG: hypothetical protein GY721_13515 [Deltaproteobacteria bacterium]|jgi:hypothetical protein|nr:hypothetical protein [Deltaproteobacteria bacterium]
MFKYQVIVGNVGTVYDGDGYHESLEIYSHYKKASKSGVGRASGEDVALVVDGDIRFETLGSNYHDANH